MSIRLQNYLLIVGLSLLISVILVISSASFIRKQNEANLRLSMKAQATSFAALLDQLDLRSIDEQALANTINRDYGRIIDRLLTNHPDFEFYLLNASASEVLWSLSAKGPPSIRWDTLQTQSLLKELASEGLKVIKTQTLFSEPIETKGYIAFAPVKPRAKDGIHPTQAIFVCELRDASQISELGRELWIKYIVSIFSAIFFAMLIAEIVSRIIHKGIIKLNLQITATIEHPGDYQFKPDIVMETNALGDALETLGSLLKGARQKTKQNTIEGNLLGTQDRVCSIYRSHFSKPVCIELADFSFQASSIGASVIPWFAAATQVGDTTYFFSGICAGDPGKWDAHLQANTCKYKALAALREFKQSSESLIDSLVKGYNLEIFAITEINDNTPTLTTKVWTRSTARTLEFVSTYAASETKCISLAFEPENQKISQAYLQNFQHDSIDQINRELTSILNDSARDVLTLIRFKPTSV